MNSAKLSTSGRAQTREACPDPRLSQHFVAYFERCCSVLVFTLLSPTCTLHTFYVAVYSCSKLYDVFWTLPPTPSILTGVRCAVQSNVM